MKIYNKKKFADGCFFLVLGAALAGAMIWKREIDGKSVVLALIAMVIGADALVRSLSRRLSYQDKVEALDERNIQVELRARSRTLSLLRGTLMAVLILSPVSYPHLDVYKRQRQGQSLPSPLHVPAGIGASLAPFFPPCYTEGSTIMERRYLALIQIILLLDPVEHQTLTALTDVAEGGVDPGRIPPFHNSAARCV